MVGVVRSVTNHLSRVNRWLSACALVRYSRHWLHTDYSCGRQSKCKNFQKQRFFWIVKTWNPILIQNKYVIRFPAGVCRLSLVFAFWWHLRQHCFIRRTYAWYNSKYWTDPYPSRTFSFRKLLCNACQEQDPVSTLFNCETENEPKQRTNDVAMHSVAKDFLTLVFLSFPFCLWHPYQPETNSQILFP